MGILRYKYFGGKTQDWDFEEIEFGKLNLLVGDSATGKTRLLNTIFNLGAFVASDTFVTNCNWDITLLVKDVKYNWHIRTQEKNTIYEKLSTLNDDGSEKLILERDSSSFKYNDKGLPKLSSDKTSLSLLREEEKIKPLYKQFADMRRRMFSTSGSENLSEFVMIPPKIVQEFQKDHSFEHLSKTSLKLNHTLFIVSRYYSDIFNQINKYMKEAFPFIKDISIQNLSQVYKGINMPGEVPVFCIKEKDYSKWIPLHELSSGMQKILMILTDILILSDGAIYIIDEYENSLGINAIDFFPDFILDIDKDIQFFLTSHHPYIINNIEPKNWLILHRKGMKVSIKYGKEVEERFGKSRQKAFTQLINDSFYTEGVE